GHDDPLDRIIVVGSTPQDRTPGLDVGDARKSVGSAARIADDAYLIADDDPVSSESARLHRGDHAAAAGVVDQQRVPPAVDRDDTTDVGVGVARAILGTRPSTPAWPLVLGV